MINRDHLEFIKTHQEQGVDIYYRYNEKRRRYDLTLNVRGTRQRLGVVFHETLELIYWLRTLMGMGLQIKSRVKLFGDI